MLTILLVAGCDNPLDDLAQSWQVDRLRVLAVAAEPAEPRPGDVVTFTSLTVAPPGEEASFIGWFACLPESADDYGCTVDDATTEALGGLEGELSPEDKAALYKKLVAAGLVGVEPYFPPLWTVPKDALSALPEADRREGLNAVISVFASPEDATSEADLELAYKRVPVSEATTPNHNPTCAGLSATGQVAAGQEVAVTLSLGADAIETYDYVTSDGGEEEREEQPYVLWYTTAGSFDQTATLDPDYEVTWTAPAEAGTVKLWAVVRDRRGGMCWSALDVSVG